MVTSSLAEWNNHYHNLWTAISLSPRETVYLVLLFPILLPQTWKSILGQANCALWSFSFLSFGGRRWVLAHWKHYHLALSPNVFVLFCCWDRACLRGGLHWPEVHYLELTSTPCFCTQALETEECATMFGSPPFSICFLLFQVAQDGLHLTM